MWLIDKNARGGGGGALPCWQWRGRVTEQGIIFTVIGIGTGYLNLPNCLLASCYVYNRIASRAFPRVPIPQCLSQTGPRSISTSECSWQAHENSESVRTSTGYAYESFCNVYCDRVYFCRLTSGTPSKYESSAPPPPLPGTKTFFKNI